MRIQLAATPRAIARRIARCCAVGLLAVTGVVALGQSQMEKEGIVIHWGVMPVGDQHGLEHLYGGKPVGGGKVNHLVVAVADSKTGKRIDNAVVRAQLKEPGIVDGPPKYLPLITGEDQPSYGQLFGMVESAPYRFTVTVRLPDRSKEIVYQISATPPAPVPTRYSR